MIYHLKYLSKYVVHCIQLRLEKNHITTSFVNSKQFPDTDSRGKKNSLYTGVTLLEHSESFLFEKGLFKK